VAPRRTEIGAVERDRLDLDQQVGRLRLGVRHVLDDDAVRGRNTGFHGNDSPPRHGRACRGHPRLSWSKSMKSWMPGTSPGMTPAPATDRLGGLHLVPPRADAGHAVVVAVNHLHRLALAVLGRLDAEEPRLLALLVRHPAPLMAPQARAELAF